MQAVADAADADLVEAVRAGNTEAFTVLYARHLPVVRTILRDHARNPDDVADLVQEVFTRALASLASLRSPGSFRYWLQSIARHVGRDARQQASRHRTDDEAAEDVPALDPGQEDLAAFLDLAAFVGDVMVELSPRDALAVSLAYLGFGPTEVASALDVRYGAAKVILHRARRRLRTAIALRLLLNGRDAGCATFAALREHIQRGSLTAHVDGCETCGSVLETVRG
jgi:RNA polymerase sigma factor (sigma-70 family)